MADFGFSKLLDSDRHGVMSSTLNDVNPKWQVAAADGAASLGGSGWSLCNWLGAYACPRKAACSLRCQQGLANRDTG